jgi:hypothetical protein
MRVLTVGKIRRFRYVVSPMFLQFRVFALMPRVLMPTHVPPGPAIFASEHGS